MKTEYNIKVCEDKLLKKVTRMFDNSPRGVMLELLQNCRRAGASKIEVDIDDNMMRIQHDGRTFSEDDVKNLLSLGGSSWEDSVNNEDPAGCGAFICALFDETIIDFRDIGDRKKGYALKMPGHKLTEINSKITVDETKCSELAEWANVSLRIYDDFENKMAYLEPLDDFPVLTTIRINEKGGAGTSTKTNKHCYAYKFANDLFQSKNIIFEKSYNGTRFLALRNLFSGYNSYSPSIKYYNSTFLNYHGHVVNLDNFPEFKFIDFIAALGYHNVNKILLLPEDDCGLRLVLPGRYSLVKDSACARMYADLKLFMTDLVNHVGSHCLPFSIYKCLPGIKNEADKPSRLKQLSKNIKYIMPATPESPLLKGILSGLEPSYDKLAAVDLAQFKGYSWYNELTLVEEHDIRLRLTREGESMKIDFVDIYDCGKKIELKNGGAEKIELVDIRGNVLVDLPCAFVMSEDFIDCIPEFAAFLKRGTSIETLFDIMMAAWEPSYDNEADSPDTQKDYISKELMESLQELFCPEKYREYQLTSIFDSCHYNLSWLKHAVFIDDNGDKYEYSKNEHGFFAVKKMK